MRHENNGRFGEPGWGFRLKGQQCSCQELEETKAKVRNVPRASGPAACTMPRGQGCQGRGSMGRENSWSLRFEQVKRESSWAGRVGGTVSGSRSSRWKVPVTARQAGSDPACLGTGLLDPPQQFRG